MKTRRKFLGLLGRLGLTSAAAPLVAAPKAQAQSTAPPPGSHYDLVVIGTGFGGTMTALTVAYKMQQKLGGTRAAAPLRILMLERGTWWTTPLETVQDKRVSIRDFLVSKQQPTQEWSSLSDARGMLDLVTRCRHSDSRPQGLYDFAPIGQRGFIFTRNDGVSVLRASGVGGGSLIYSKISIRPPETLFDDKRWPGDWRGSAGAALRSKYFGLATDSIHSGIESMIVGTKAIHTGVSNIVTKTAHLTPDAERRPAPNLAMPPIDGKRLLLQINIKNEKDLHDYERELIDRARVFQTAMKKITPYYGSVDLAINDMSTDSEHPTAKARGKNFCERHGRCNVGCLPGAGQTLNKQIMQALYGRVTDTFDKDKPENFECVLRDVQIELNALAEVDLLSESPDGSYAIHYRQRRAADPTASPERVAISADRVVVAAGTLGTTELMLRSQQRSVETQGAEGLHALSPALGKGFSPNGDHIALLEETRERVSLTQGPVTTSVGQFNPLAPEAAGFHQIEDQGVPRAFAALARHGFDVMEMLAERHNGIERFLRSIGGALSTLHNVFNFTPTRTRRKAADADMSEDRPESEDELTATMMCIVAQGKDAANGRFRLDGKLLRMERDDGKAFHEDPIYQDIRASLAQLAKELRPADSKAEFISPLADAVLPTKKPMVLTSHPLGGCPMGDTAASGVVDPYGRVFRIGSGPALYPGLYIADGSVIPSALGVNPSLTIAAIALRCADQMLDEWNSIAAKGARSAPSRECKV